MIINKQTYLTLSLLLPAIMALPGCPRSVPGPIYQECDCVAGSMCERGQCVPKTENDSSGATVDVLAAEAIEHTDESRTTPADNHGTLDASDLPETADSDAPQTQDFTAPGQGTIIVHFQYEGQVPLQNIEVALATAPADCLDFGATDDWNAAEMVNGIDSKPQFASLEGGQYYLVAARGNHDGQIAAAGCADKIYVPPEGGEISVDVPLFLLLLNPAGDYDATLTLDLEPLFPSSFIQLSLQIAATDETLHTEVAAAMAEVVANNCFGFGPGVCEQLQDALETILPGCIQKYHQPLSGEFLEASSQMSGMLSPLTLSYLLKLQPPQGQFMIKGTQNWEELSIRWDWGCPPDDPDYELCTTRSFTLTELDSAPYPVKLTAADFTAELVNFDVLIIDTHTLSLSTRELVLFLLHSVVFPAATEFAGLHQWQQTLGMDCPALGQCVGTLLFAPFPDEIPLFAQACESSVQKASADLQADIADFAATQSHLKLHGTCTLIDDDGNLHVDDLGDGVVWGHEVLDGSDGSEFTGVFEAHKK